MSEEQQAKVKRLYEAARELDFQFGFAMDSAKGRTKAQLNEAWGEISSATSRLGQIVEGADDG